MERVRVSCGQSAHLAGVAVPFQNNRPCLFRDSSGKSGKSFVRGKEVLPWFQVGTVFMRKDLISLFVAKLPDSPRPFGLPAGSFLKFAAFNDAPLVCQQKFENQLPAV
jgi:hypothetical protein